VSLAFDRKDYSIENQIRVGACTDPPTANLLARATRLRGIPDPRH
jgi:hypothetical protein